MEGPRTGRLTPPQRPWGTFWRRLFFTLSLESECEFSKHRSFQAEKVVRSNGDVPEHAGLPVTRGPCAGSRLSPSHPALPAFSVGWGRRGQALSQFPHPWDEDQRGISHAPVGDSVTPGTWSTEQQAGTLGSHTQADTLPSPPNARPAARNASLQSLFNWSHNRCFEAFAQESGCRQNKAGLPESSPDDSRSASSLLTFGARRFFVTVGERPSRVLQVFSSIPGPHPPAASNNPQLPITQL